MRKRIMSLLLCAVCYLGIHNGYLALFDSSQQGPVMILPYKEELYPQKDRDALRKGIIYSSPEELTRLLEDFLS